MSSLIDEIMKEAMQRGDFDNLPGSGRRLKLEDDPNTPEDMKLAYKMLKENDLAPDWIAQGKALEQEHEKLIARIERLEPDVDATRMSALRKDVERYNRDILTFNLKLPPGIAHRRQINLDKLLRR